MLAHYISSFGVEAHEMLTIPHVLPSCTFGVEAHEMVTILHVLLLLSDTNFYMPIEQEVLHAFCSSSCANGKMRKRQRQCGDDGGKPSLPVSQLTLLDNNGERVFPRFLDAAVSERCGSNSLNAARHAAASNAPVVTPKRVPPLPPVPWRLQLPQLPLPVMVKQCRVVCLRLCLCCLRPPCPNNVVSLLRHRLGVS